MRALLAIAFAAALCGQDLKRIEPQGYVSDYANVVSPATRQAIHAYLQSLEEVSGVQVAIVTIPSLQGAAIEDVTIDLYRRWGVGRKPQDEGALFLLAIQDRRSRLEVGYGLEAVLPDAAAGDILRAMRPALRERKYGEALREAAAQLGERIARAKNVELPRALPSNYRPATPSTPGTELGPGEIVFLVVLGLLAVWLLSRSRGGRGRGGPWIIPMGGGFGGASSGGGSSWGGFGGGDAGGGGASSDW